jgi:glycosyltransferase involved in cell wall biosynthesis
MLPLVGRGGSRPPLGGTEVARLLFFTPVMPGVTGQGTAIRAGIALELLAERFEVTVVHVDLWTGDPGIADRTWPRRIATAYHFISTPVAPDAAEQLVKKHLSKESFDAVYVYRLVAAPFALRVMGLLPLGTIPKVLDLDDDECARTEQFMMLRGGAINTARASRAHAELHRQRGFQRMMMLRFDVSLLASAEDLDSMTARNPSQKFVLLPNVMRVPEQPPARGAHTSGSLLFLGTLDYFPNEDATLFFADSILPLLLESGNKIEFRIVGIKVPSSIHALRGRAGLTVVGPVKDVETEYARAHMLVVPLRAGSGTRIKILEAFRFMVPVVSTSVGAAGLDLRHEVHLLIANTPEEFSAACLRLMEDDQFATTLAQNAFEWLRTTLSLGTARNVLHSLFEQPVSVASPHPLS